MQAAVHTASQHVGLKSCNLALLITFLSDQHVLLFVHLHCLYIKSCDGHLHAGKYKPGGVKPFGPRNALFTDEKLRQIQPLVDAIKAIADEREKTMAQVSWAVNDVNT